MSELFDRFSAAYKALEVGDVSLMDEILADDVIFTTPERVMRGKAEAMERFRANQDAFSGMELKVDYDTMVIDAGDSCAVEFIISGTFTGDLNTDRSINDGNLGGALGSTGRGFSIRTTDHVWWRDGKIYRFNVYYDPNEAVSQLQGDAGELTTAG